MRILIDTNVLLSNIKDFEQSKIKAISPDDFVQKLSK